MMTDPGVQISQDSVLPHCDRNQCNDGSVDSCRVQVDFSADMIKEFITLQPGQTVGMTTSGQPEVESTNKNDDTVMMKLTRQESCLRMTLLANIISETLTMTLPQTWEWSFQKTEVNDSPTTLVDENTKTTGLVSDDRQKHTAEDQTDLDTEDHRTKSDTLPSEEWSPNQCESTTSKQSIETEEPMAEVQPPRKRGRPKKVHKTDPLQGSADVPSDTTRSSVDGALPEQKAVGSARRRRGRPPKRCAVVKITGKHSHCTQGDRDVSMDQTESDIKAKKDRDAQILSDDFSDWQPTEKKFKKRKNLHTNIPTDPVVISDAKTAINGEQNVKVEKYKHKIKTDRSFNKKLYTINKRIAKEMNFDLLDSAQVCIICGNRSNTHWHLLVHLRRFHVMSADDYFEVLLLPPEERTKKLDSLRDLKVQDVKKHTPKMAGKLPCSYCNEHFLGIRNMKRHLMLKHRKEPDFDQQVAHFTKEFAKLIHKNRMVAIRKENLTKTEYPCKYCGLVLAMSCTRSRHQMYTCPLNPDRKKRVHCTYCGTAYKTRDALEKHMKTHAKHDFKYVCELCGKVCRNKPMLYEHKLKDHSGKPLRYACTICDKAFHYKDQMKKHQAAHSDVREAMCNICGKLFKTNDDVKKHTKHVHEGNYPYRCDLCGHGVAKLSYLKSHKCGRVRRAQEDTLSKTAGLQVSGKPKRVRKVHTDTPSSSARSLGDGIPPAGATEDTTFSQSTGYLKQDGNNKKPFEPKAPDQTTLASQYVVSNTMLPLTYQSETPVVNSGQSTNVPYVSGERTKEYTLLPSLATITPNQAPPLPVPYPTISYGSNTAPMTFYPVYDNQHVPEPTQNTILQSVQTVTNTPAQVAPTPLHSIQPINQVTSNPAAHGMQSTANAIPHGIQNVSTSHTVQSTQAAMTGNTRVHSTPDQNSHAMLMHHSTPEQELQSASDLVPQGVGVSHSLPHTGVSHSLPHTGVSDIIPPIQMTKPGVMPQTSLSHSLPHLYGTVSMSIPQSVMTGSSSMVAADSDITQPARSSSTLSDVTAANPDVPHQQLQQMTPSATSQISEYEQPYQ